MSAGGGTPYIGSKISLISKAQIRYEGILSSVDTERSTVALAKGGSVGREVTLFSLNQVCIPVILLSSDNVNTFQHFKYCEILLIAKYFKFQIYIFFKKPHHFFFFFFPPPSVKSYGTEDRHTDRPVPSKDEIYEYIIFRGSDIKDITVSEPPKSQHGLPCDPAIVQVCVCACT